MTRRILKKPQVERDLVEHFSFIAQDKIEPADRFLRVAEASFKFIAEHPGVGQAWNSPIAQLDGIRVYMMPKSFRSYLIYYRPIDNGVEILTVLHGSRDRTTVVERLEVGE